MRISIHMTREEQTRREALLQKSPDEHTDAEFGIAAEAIWEAVPDGIPVEGVDLRDASGALLYTIVGDPE